MNEKIAENIWKFSGRSNVYLIKLEKNVLIDCGEKDDAKELISSLQGIGIRPEDIDIIIFTHLHYDHCGNFALFRKAEFYAGRKEISSFEHDANGTVLNKRTAEELKSIKVGDVVDLKIHELKVINTPGHTRGSICILYEPKNRGNKILFSGDTLFRAGYGRTDLLTSVPAELDKSIKKLNKLNYGILCTGHDY